MNLLINPTKMTACGQTPPPLGLLYLAAMAETTVFDGAMLQQPTAPFLEQHRPKIVGVTMYTSARHDALETLRFAKEMGATTVAGGPHVGTCKQQLSTEYPFIDHLVIGDGELAWQVLCRGDSLPKMIEMPVRDLDYLPLPAWDKVDFNRYPANGSMVHRGNDLRILPRVSIVLGRGCNGSCSFCSTWWVNGKYRAHGSAWMERHFALLWQLGVRHLVFQDDCLTADRTAALDLCRVLQEFSFSWSGTTRADAIDDELVKQMVQAGCYELHFGVESGSVSLLQRMRKNVRLDDVLQARKICRENGVAFVALMMCGYPYETDQDRLETTAFLEQLEPDNWSSYDETFILPGTALYTDCKQRRFIDDSFWLTDVPFFRLEGLRLVKDCPEVADLATISGWGPASTKPGKAFNVQPAGNSAFWCEKEGSFPSTLHIMFDDIMLPTQHSGTLATAEFPHNKLAALLATPGKYGMFIFDGLRRVRQRIGSFTIE